MEPLETVALYAILLREAARNHHTSAEAHLDDIVCCPDDLSLATLAAGHQFGPLEWELAALLYDAPGKAITATARLLHEEEEPRLAEALLHAYGPRGKRTHAEWAEPYRQRWHEVRASIRAFEAEGIADSFGELSRNADRAYMQATGIGRDEFYEQFPPEELPAATSEPLHA